MNSRRLMLAALIIFLVATGAVAAEHSLAEAARRARQQRGKETKVVKVFTNDNLPPPAPWETVSPSPEVAKSTAESEAVVETKAKQTDSAGKTAEPTGEKSENNKKTKAYWQDKFTAARNQLASAESAHGLAQDELNLLQIQQAREFDPSVQSQVAAKIEAKQAELAVDQTRVDKARHALDDLQKDFDASGVPAEWRQTEQPSTDDEAPNQ